MILYTDKDRRIYAYKADVADEVAKAEEIRGAGIFYDGEFDFFMGENRAGLEKTFYLNEDGTIRIEYDEPMQKMSPLSAQEELAIDTALNVEYIACLMEANLQ